MQEIDQCPNCGHDTTADTRFPGSTWCKPCVEVTLVEQREQAKVRVRPQVFKI